MTELSVEKFEERCEPIVAHMAQHDIGAFAYYRGDNETRV